MLVELYKCHRIAGPKGNVLGWNSSSHFRNEVGRLTWEVMFSNAHKDAQEVVWLGCFTNSVPVEHSEMV